MDFFVQCNFMDFQGYTHDRFVYNAALDYAWTLKTTQKHDVFLKYIEK